MASRRVGNVSQSLQSPFPRLFASTANSAHPACGKQKPTASTPYRMGPAPDAGSHRIRCDTFHPFLLLITGCNDPLHPRGLSARPRFCFPHSGHNQPEWLHHTLIHLSFCATSLFKMSIYTILSVPMLLNLFIRRGKPWTDVDTFRNVSIDSSNF